MDNTLIVLGRYSGQTFIPDSPLPHAEGAAQLIITPTTSPRSCGACIRTTRSTGYATAAPSSNFRPASGVSVRAAPCLAPTACRR